MINWSWPRAPRRDDRRSAGLTWRVSSSCTAWRVASKLQRFLSTHRTRQVTIIGGGYIGLEMAEALTHRGIHVTLLQRGASILSTVDPSLGARVRATLERHHVDVTSNAPVSAIERHGRRLRVRSADTTLAECDAILVATGVEPDTVLAREAGLALGSQGAIAVGERMATAIPGVHAAGDCVVTHHRLLPEPTYLPLGTTAHKQGRVAGENAAGGSRRFAGSIGTQVVRVFETVVARTGLLERESLAAGYAPLTIEIIAWDHKVYYPGAQEMVVRLTADHATERVLGRRFSARLAARSPSASMWSRRDCMLGSRWTSSATSTSVTRHHSVAPGIHCRSPPRRGWWNEEQDMPLR
jgi:NADPH-dependent 2,4-dienoyl-CoA reductase/sulfur reductase-like enzyme